MGTDRDLDRLSEELLAEARGEKPSDAVKERVLGELVGEVPGSSGSTHRWLAAGIAVALLALLLWFGLSRSDAPLAETPQPETPVVADAGPTTAPEPTQPSTPDPLPIAPIDPGPTQVPDASVSPAKPSIRARQVTPEDEVDALAREVALVDSARKLLAEDPTEAMKLLDSHRRSFPHGSLGVEVNLLRLEALVKLGRRDEAARLGQRLTGTEPNGPVGLRVQRLLNEGSP